MYSIVVLTLTSLPYLIGFFEETPEWRFSGFVFNVEDGNSYIAKMLRGVNGDWLFRSPYSSRKQSGVLAFFPYIVLGKMASGVEMHTQLVALYQLFRWLAGLFVLYSTYTFLALFVESIWMRRLGLVFATLGGGLGWLPVVLGYPRWLDSIPLEYYSPETFGFLSIYGIPHLAMARGLLLSALRAFLIDDSNKYRGLIIGLTAVLAGLFQPLSVAILGSLITLYLLVTFVWLRIQIISTPEVGINWSGQFKVSLVACLVVLPFVAYNLIAFRDPYVRQWTAQNVILSPHPLQYLLAYGCVLPFAVVGGHKVIANNNWKGILPVLWVVMLPILAYFPFNLQRRLPDGVWVAMLSLLFYGLERFKNDRVRIRLSIVLSLLLLPSSLFLLAGGVRTALKTELPVYVPGAQVAAFEFLAGYAEPDSVVLSSFRTGNSLPAWAPVRVVIGHGPESAGLEELLPEIEKFYSPETSNQERISLLDRLAVDYVYWGEYEGDWGFEEGDFLKVIYDQGGERIYQVYFSGQINDSPSTWIKIKLNNLH